MEIINYKAELNRNICYKLNGKIVSVPKTFVDELGTINDIIQDFDKKSKDLNLLKLAAIEHSKIIRESSFFSNKGKNNLER